MSSTATITFTIAPSPTIVEGQSYPTNYTQSVESSEDIYDDVIQDRTFAGIIKTRSLVPVTYIKKVFTVVHPALTLAQKQWLLDYYKTNRDSTFAFQWKAEATGDDEYAVYSVKFITQPKFTIIGGTWWKATVQLAEV